MKPGRRQNKSKASTKVTVQCLPSYLAEHVKSTTNFSLLYEKGSTWQTTEQKDDHKGGGRQERHGATRLELDPGLRETARKIYHNQCVTAAGPLLKVLHERQQAVLASAQEAGLLVWEFRAKATSRYVSGLGAVHPTETGLVLDRNTGVPYVPASSLKGVLRLAHALNVARSPGGAAHVRRGRIGADGKFEPTPDGDEVRLDDREPSLRRLFGDVDTSLPDATGGALVLLDAYPLKPPSLVLDILNPHYPSYYQGKSAIPHETDNPIPLTFLAVETGAEFAFRCMLLPRPRAEADGSADRAAGPEADRGAVRAMFQTALTELGLGAKTALGYGRFSEPEEHTESCLREISARKEKERAKQAAEQARATFEAMSRFEQLRAIFGNDPVAPEAERSQYKKYINELEGLDKEQRRPLATLAKKRLQEDGEWDVKPGGKKNKKAARVQKLKKMLEEN